MRKAKVYFKGEEAGLIEQQDDGTFTFIYNWEWQKDSTKPSISLTLPKSQREYSSAVLFPFFYNMLPEGTNKKLVCKCMHIDEDDYFGLLLATARYDTIGAITIKKIAQGI